MPNSSKPYSLKQALEFTEVAPQTLRHWREVLPPLQGRKAHRSGFSARDLLAILVVKTWVNELGGQVSYLKQHAEALFSLCAEESWPKLEQSLLVHDLGTKKWDLVSLGEPLTWMDGATLLPVNKLAAKLREQLTGEIHNPQQALDFPLMSVNSDSLSKTSASRHKEMR